MTNEQINIAIAEACGWKLLETPLDDCGFAAYAKDPNGCPCPSIPDYCKDLNAMREAEIGMTEPMRQTYEQELQRVLLRTYEENSWLVSATARQRAEAFLRTIGKWEEAAK